MVPLKTCRVSCFDLKQIEHTGEVSAGSVYEAVAQALRMFRDDEWVEDIGRGQTPITVKVKHPEIERARADSISAAAVRAHGSCTRLRALARSQSAITS